MLKGKKMTKRGVKQGQNYYGPERRLRLCKSNPGLLQHFVRCVYKEAGEIKSSATHDFIK